MLKKNLQQCYYYSVHINNVQPYISNQLFLYFYFNFKFNCVNLLGNFKNIKSNVENFSIIIIFLFNIFYIVQQFNKIFIE